MEKFNKPSNLNGTELRAELNAAGVVISNDLDAVAIDENENLLLKIDKKHVEKAQLVVSAHNGTVVAPEATIDEKLASVGLSINSLKTALGL
jgi:hypothetical protein